MFKSTFHVLIMIEINPWPRATTFRGLWSVSKYEVISLLQNVHKIMQDTFYLPRTAWAKLAIKNHMWEMNSVYQYIFLFLDQFKSNWFSNLQYTSECIYLILTYNKHLLDIQNSRKHFFRNSILNKYWIKSCFLPLSTYIASLICINDCCLFGRHTPYVRDEQNVAPGRNVLILGTVVAHSGARSGWGRQPQWG